MIKKIAVVNGVRTPFIKAWTLFEDMPAQKLGALCVTELLQRTEIDPNLVDEVIIGCVGQPIDAANVARVISLLAGIPKSKKAYSVNRNCASGFEAVTSAVEKISVGQDEIVIAGGAESMSNAPLVFSKEAVKKFMKLGRAKTFMQKLSVMAQFRPKHFAPQAALGLALTDPTCGLNMGQTAEVLAKKFAISRERQDVFALESHLRVLASREKLKEEMMTVFIPPTYDKTATEDNGAREGQSMEALTKLRPAFDRRTGTVTAGNSSQITDGAVALLVMTEQRAVELGFTPLGVLTGYSYAGCDPSRMGLGPLFAIAKAEGKA